jgi:hypothetical protein
MTTTSLFGKGGVEKPLYPLLIDEIACRDMPGKVLVIDGDPP